MYLQHFGLKYDPLGKSLREVVNHPQYNQLKNKLDCLLHTNGIALITGEAGTGKTTALRKWSQSLNPLTHQFIYQSDNHFKSFDIYSQLADHLGLDKQARYSRLWRSLKDEILSLHDNKQIKLIWILDEAHAAPNSFFADLPAFLNFSFDSREVMTIILSGLPKLQSLLGRTSYNALTSRLLFNFSWQALDDFEQFSQFISCAFKQAGKQEMLISNTGLNLLHMASKGRLRYAHQVVTQSLQAAYQQNLNHIPDEIIERVIDEIRGLKAF